MGFLSKIWSKAKTAYSNIDRAVGGRLPGGQTPQENQIASIPPSQPAPVAPTISQPQNFTPAAPQPTNLSPQQLPQSTVAPASEGPGDYAYSPTAFSKVASGQDQLNPTTLTNIQEAHPYLSLAAEIAMPGPSVAEGKAVAKASGTVLDYLNKKAVGEMFEITTEGAASRGDRFRLQALYGIPKYAKQQVMDTVAKVKETQSAKVEEIFTKTYQKMEASATKVMDDGVSEFTSKTAGGVIDDGLEPIFNAAGEFTGYKPNTVWGKITSSGIYTAAQKISPIKALAITGAVLWMADKSLGTRGTVLWGRGDLQDMLPFTREDLIDMGEYELADEVKAFNDDISNPGFWTEVQTYIPGIGIKEIDENKQRANEIRNKMLDIQQRDALIAEEIDPEATLLNPPYDSEQWWAKKAAEDQIVEMQVQQ
ncbi:MAG: hypothetical protein CMI54_00800, partial [Parcubacteria group bacterium]|nr:hypothetical protein [Parcubacteria group bacterium]